MTLTLDRKRRRALSACLAAGLLLALSSAVSAQDGAPDAAPAEAKAPDAKLIASLEKLAQAGNAEAIYHLGMASHLGLNLPKDKAKALDAFRRAAGLGDPLAAYKLGCYYDGESDGLLADDPDQALKYKLIAAEAGYALAQHDVALLYADRGDYAQAREWMGKAAAQGWPESLRAYASIHNGVAGVARDRAVAAAYFRLFNATKEATEAHKTALAEFEGTLSAEEKARADTIVAGYRPEPTELTLRAVSGERAAKELVERVAATAPKVKREVGR